MSEQSPYSPVAVMEGPNPAAANLAQTASTPQEQLELEHMFSLDKLQTGAAYDINPDVSLYPSEDINQPSVLQDGTTVTVVAEVGIPTKWDGPREKLVGALNFAVLACKTPENTIYYAMAGLQSDENGKMAIAPSSSPQWLDPHAGGLRLGRKNEEHFVDATAMWPKAEGYGNATSREHITFTANPDGSLRMSAEGGNGTWAKFGSAEKVQDSPASQPEDVRPVDALVPSKELRFQAIEDDPAFQTIAAPFKAKLDEIRHAHSADIARADAALSDAASRGPQAYSAAMAERTKAYAALTEAQRSTREAYRQAILPYVSARRELFSNDIQPGYNQPGEAQYDQTKQGVVSKGGTGVSRRLPGFTRLGNATYTSETPKLGQLVLPRGATWQGAGGGYAYINGEQKSTSELITQLAADMVAGTGAGYDLPVTYYRDIAAEEELSDGLKGTMPVYRIHEGLAYVVASRLVYGNDKALYSAQQIDPRTLARL